ncbi:alpha/beta fold hydrolase [uncultured Muriicola sp.]|uniref:alpha/beta hydrolase n=1 Tax=uncultured Muriicola sp. TaxID=1583102 RepID=UPI00261A7E46|nr:alpha/beta fold hydrolase [uncultured Muriicola sp.]
MKKVITSKWFWVPLGILVLLVGFYFYKAQFRGVKQEIYFTSDIELRGLLLKPDTTGPHPAIILLHGAGGSHQHHNKAFFRFHANAFLEKGFAVLVYTKRGSGNDGFNYDYFTYKDLVNDAYAAINFLRNQQDIDQQNIGLMGVSESGWFTPELAFLDRHIKFIINRVSSPLSFENTVIHEVKMDALTEGFTEMEIMEDILPLTRQIWQYYIAVSKDPALAKGEEREEINARLKEAHGDERLGKWFQYKELAAYDSLKYAARGFNFGYDPLPFLEKIDLPMLYVMAGKDKNIPTQEVVDFLKVFRQTNQKDIQLKVFPEASHYLFKWGLEDGPYEGWLYQEGYLETITNWAAKSVTR